MLQSFAIPHIIFDDFYICTKCLFLWENVFFRELKKIILRIIIIAWELRRNSLLKSEIRKDKRAT